LIRYLLPLKLKRFLLLVGVVDDGFATTQELALEFFDFLLQVALLGFFLFKRFLFLFHLLQQLFLFFTLAFDTL
jgi:hypothetical protein